MDLNELKPIPGSRKKRKRVGRGTSSGHGKTSTRGQKGQRSRAGRSVGRGFEGGQMPLQRRLPKRGFSNVAFRTNLAVVNLREIADLPEHSVVDMSLFRATGLVSGACDGVKVLGDGEVLHPLVVHATRFSTSAKAKILAAGGQAIEVDRQGRPIASDASAS